MTSYYTDLLAHARQFRQQEGLQRRRTVAASKDSTRCFSRNDYLSLASHESIRRAFLSGFSCDPIGSGGSMMVCGYHKAHQDLEHAFAEALQVDGCVLFSSGYAANLSVVSMLEAIKPIVLIDKSVHASVYDGLKLSQVPYKRFLHNNLSDLKLKLQQFQSFQSDALAHSRPIIMTESVFSMSGQRAPLQAMYQLASSQQIPLLVDEAHAFGVLGEQGLGAVVEAGLTQQEVPLRMIPFGKALGASGAIVAGHAEWIEAILQTRPAVYSTSMSPAYARGLQAILQIVRAADDRRAWLKQLIDYFRLQTQSSPLKWRDSTTPIQQLQLGCPHRATELADFLARRQIVCLPMRQPTVTRAETGLRVILNYHHQPEHIDVLFEAIHQCVRES